MEVQILKQEFVDFTLPSEPAIYITLLIVTIIALAIHNLIEGLTLYNITLTSIKSGLLMMISIALHNIPLGFQIGNTIKLNKNSKKLYKLVCFI